MALPQPEPGNAKECIAPLEESGPRSRVVSPRRIAQIIMSGRVDERGNILYGGKHQMVEFMRERLGERELI